MRVKIGVSKVDTNLEKHLPWCVMQQNKKTEGNELRYRYSKFIIQRNVSSLSKK